VLIRAELAGAVSSVDRLRARSLSSVPQEAAASPRGGGLAISSEAASAETDSSSEEQPDQQVATVAAGLSIAAGGRVYAAHSLPSHIWSLNGERALLLHSGTYKNFLVDVCFGFAMHHIVFV